MGRKKRREKTGRKVQRVSRIKGATSIDLRPKSVDKRKISGHWETDNMEGVKTDKKVLSISSSDISIPSGTTTNLSSSSLVL